jgi:hypothetical protein
MENKITTIKGQSIVNSALASQASSLVSKNYAFFSTKELIDTMFSLGFGVSSQSEKRTKKIENQGYQKHVLRFRALNESLKIGNDHLEVVVSNSHDGKSSLQLSLGVFRLVCANGLTVGTSVFENFKIRHSNINREKIKQGLDLILSQKSKLDSIVNKMKSIELTYDQARVLGQTIFKKRFEGIDLVSYDLDRVLKPKRNEDTENNAWVVLNRIQESVIRGGIPFVYNATSVNPDTGVTETKIKKGTTRQIKSIDTQKQLNDLVFDSTLELIGIAA